MKDLKAIRIIEGTKISHDYSGNQVQTFSYRDLMSKGLTSIGIPAKQNGLIIVDIDVAGINHKHDGREWWTNFANLKGLDPTYTVGTKSGGMHFYYKLPLHIDPDLFAPPAALAPGVDLKYNGWVAAPPTEGYSILHGDASNIAVAPQALMDEICNKIQNPRSLTEFTGDNTAVAMASLHKPYSDAQIRDLKKRLEWMQTNGDISYAEWRDGIFALKAGIDDPELLEEMVEMWTHNRSFAPGDEIKAKEICERAEKYGAIGPGSIFGIIKENMLREGAVDVQSPLSVTEVFDRSGVELKVDNAGGVNVEANETNLSMLIGAMFPVEELFHDTRNDLYIFKGKSVSDTELANTLCPMIQSRKSGLGLGKIKRSTIQGGLEVLMNIRRIDPHKKWLEELKWDGVNRIDNFFNTYLEVPNDDYVQTVSKNFWLSLAARGIRPGCKFDSVLVIEGKEGIRKSSFLEVIAGDYLYAPTSDHSFKDLDDLRKMHQSVIVELPELLGLIKQNANTVKGFLSSREDYIRELYARKSMKSPRGFIFVGTTNDDAYLRRDMGGRRFWPIKIPDHVKQINTNAIACDRDQLYAEAVSRVQSGEKFYSVPEHLHDMAVKSKVVREPLAGPISEILNHVGHTFTIEEIYTKLHVMGFITKGLTISSCQRIENGLLGNSCKQFVDDEGVEKWERKPSQDIFHIPVDPAPSELSAFL